MLVQFSHDGVERLGEHRVRGVQAHSHAEYLCALAGEDEDGLAAGRRRALDDRYGFTGGEFVEAGQQLLAITADDDGPVLEVRPARQRPRHIADVELAAPA